MKKRKNKINLIIYTVLIIIIAVSICYSTFGLSLLRDKDKVNIIYKEDIKLTDVKVDSSSSNVVSNLIKFNDSTLNTSVKMPYSDSVIIYKIEITNYENTEMGLYNIDGIPENFDYELKDYVLKDKICVDNSCSLGIKKVMYLILKYKDGKYDQNDINYNLDLSFDFRKFYKVNCDNSISINCPKEIISGDNLSVSVIDDNFSIFINDKLIIEDFDYDLKNKILTIKNIRGNVYIKKNTE